MTRKMLRRREPCCPGLMQQTLQFASTGDSGAAERRRWSRETRSGTIFEQRLRLQNARSRAAGPAILCGGAFPFDPGGVNPNLAWL